MQTWLSLMRAALPAPTCGPQRLTFAPFGAFAPAWAMAMGPGRNPWLAMGMAFGPFAWGLRVQEGKK